MDSEMFEYSDCKTKEDLTKLIEKQVKAIRALEGKEGKKSVKSHMAYLEFAEGFLERVKRSSLPVITTEGWEYHAYIAESTACVDLCLAEYGDNSMSILERFSLITSEPRMLNVEEYAELHGVSAVTVRQWIRRGKIRKAQKNGNEWRIPSSIEPSLGKYERALYSVTKEFAFDDVPDDYAYLKKYTHISHIWITQTKADEYKVELDSIMGEDERKTFILNGKEREKLELYLIGNPLIMNVC